MNQPAFDPADEDFEALEEAVMATSRGRWFLKEFAERNRTTDTKSVLDELSAFQAQILGSQKDVRLEVLQSELREMAKSISETRADIATLQSDDVSTDRIEAATGELDAIVDATENATSSILAAAEELQMISEKLRESGVDASFCDDIEMHTTDIFMSCSFQDLTGQRISKVVTTLHFLEQRVNMMIEVWGVEKGGPDGPVSSGSTELSPAARGDKRPDAAILGGPSVAGEGFSQDEIDAMLDGDFSSVDDGELFEAEHKAAAAAEAVEASDSDRFAGGASEDAANEEPSEAPEDSVPDDIAVAEAPDAGVEGDIAQDDIDSLFG